MTTTTQPAPRQTAGNNPFLRRVKRVFNVPIFRNTSEILNAQGEDAARLYIQQYVRGDLDALMDELIAGMDERKGVSR